MLPDSDNLPPQGFQSSVYQLVPRSVLLKLRSPEQLVVQRKFEMSWTTVPEATVHKYSDTAATEYKVRSAEDRLIPPPAFQVMLSKQKDERKFGRLVPLALDTSHHGGPLGFGEDISH